MDSNQTVYHAELGDTIQDISGVVGFPLDTTYVRTVQPFDIIEKGDQLRVSGSSAIENMIVRIFRSHSFAVSNTHMQKLTGDSALPGVDSVLVADDFGITSQNFNYYVVQAQGIGAISYKEDFGYPGGLQTGSTFFRLKAFRIGQ